MVCMVLQSTNLELGLTCELATWAASFTKLLAFNQTQYDRLIHLDSDVLVLQNMDELFFLPPSPLALPRAYWLDRSYLTSLLMVIRPSTNDFQRISQAISSAGPNDYDMEIVNQLYNNTALILPHRRYTLLSSVFRKWDYRQGYLGNDAEQWSPSEVFDEAKLVHFSDWPVPKPWIRDQKALEEEKPMCESEKECKAQEIWLGMYSYFARQRKVRYPQPSIAVPAQAHNTQGNLWASKRSTS